ncbi:probable low-specificity L-threonine aldolase 2 isoform X4 [Heterocephalus glaber]|uniref:Probable low-specificity L-threonine aldolase 2 isoform X4 n=1 Tax=Heterocephalus glaber TaxID=10181 RepID=A0AAX6RKE6_HETGA|nr:probable low-specificity L-threonine aldolase 2 isoform X4 [Heterocephalus glaber]
MSACCGQAERGRWVPEESMPSPALLPSVSVMGHCRRRGSQLLLGQECHLQVYEQGGVAQLAGVLANPLPDLPHGTLDLAELQRVLARGHGSPYHPVCELVCLENTHCSSGGRVLPIDYLRQGTVLRLRWHMTAQVPHTQSWSPHQAPDSRPCDSSGGHTQEPPGDLSSLGLAPLTSACPAFQVHLLARTYGARIHLDGARLMNAAVALRVPPAHIVEHCDSVSFCFSKGLGAPGGALVGGPKDFIEEAWRFRKALGGGMRQSGVLAAAALVGLAGAEEALLQDHKNAQRFAKGLQELASPVCSVDPATVETNMVLVRVNGLAPTELCQRLQVVSADEVAQIGRAVHVLVFPWTEQSVRAVWHRDISTQDTDLALRKWALVLRQLES